jgi:hypothetical protein
MTLQKLEQSFIWGCTDLEAFICREISKSTLYTYCEINPEFTDRKEALKTTPTLKARIVISFQIMQLVSPCEAIKYFCISLTETMPF